MLNSSQIISNYIVSNSLNYYEDQTNLNLSIPRNYIRHVMMENIFKINPGYLSMIKKKVVKKYEREK